MKIFIALVLIILLAGCVSAKYNVKTQEFKYFRMGDQKLGGIVAKVTPSGTASIAVETQESTAEALNKAVETLCNLAAAAKSAA